jgi:hypothetical protein
MGKRLTLICKAKRRKPVNHRKIRFYQKVFGIAKILVVQNFVKSTRKIKKTVEFWSSTVFLGLV